MSPTQPSRPALPTQGGPSTTPPGEQSWWTDETRASFADDGLTAPITSGASPRGGGVTAREPIPIDDGLTAPLGDARTPSPGRLEPPPDDQLTSDLGGRPADVESRWYWPEESTTGGSDQAGKTSYVEQADQETMGVDETGLDQTGHPIATPEGVTWEPLPRSMASSAPPAAGMTEPYTPQPLPQSVSPTYEQAETTYQTPASQDFTESTLPPGYEQSRIDQPTFEQPDYEQTTIKPAFVQEVAPDVLFDQDDDVGEERPPPFPNDPPG